MKNNLLPALRLTLVLLVLCALLYPLLIWGAAQLAPGQGRGVTLSQNGRVVGYANVGQKFDRPEYFNGRPSAVDYNAAGSAGSNKGPTNPEYLALVQARLDTFLLQNPGTSKNQVPAELLTASGADPATDRLQIAEEEVPREGVTVSRCFQLART